MTWWRGCKRGQDGLGRTTARSMLRTRACAAERGGRPTCRLRLGARQPKLGHVSPSVGRLARLVHLVVGKPVVVLLPLVGVDLWLHLSRRARLQKAPLELLVPAARVLSRWWPRVVGLPAVAAARFVVGPGGRGEHVLRLRSGRLHRWVSGEEGQHMYCVEEQLYGLRKATKR